MKKNKIWILIILIFIVISLQPKKEFKKGEVYMDYELNLIISPNWTYTETGFGYNCNGNWQSNYDCANVYDGNWDTYGQELGGTNAMLLSYYSVPSNLISSIYIVKVRDLRTYGIGIHSLCLDKTDVTLKLELDVNDDNSRYYCLDSNSQWILLGTILSDRIYEEGMWWNLCMPDSSCISTTCIDSTCTDNCGNIYRGTKLCYPNFISYTNSYLRGEQSLSLFISNANQWIGG